MYVNNIYICLELFNINVEIMSKSKLEYIWLDGHQPTQELRSKTKVEDDFGGKLEDCKVWSFDGSSTEQAEGSSSDCLLKYYQYYNWQYTS